MKSFLYGIVEIIAKIHSYLLKLNDAYEYNFNDKELHFLIIGALGMAMILVVYPTFKWLAENDHIMVISWIYVFTLIIVITFAIEIGQRVTNTGVMEFADIMFGVLGFITMFLVFSVLRGIYHLVQRFLKGRHGGRYEEDRRYADRYGDSRRSKSRYQDTRYPQGRYEDSGYEEERYEEDWDAEGYGDR